MVVKIERKRYLLVEFQDKIPDKGYLIHLMRRYVSLLGGQLALAQSSLHIVDIYNQFAIIRSTHQSRDIVEAAVQLLRKDDFVSVIRTVTGSIKKINDKLHTEYTDDTSAVPH